MKPDWILIANATRARLLARERGEPMAVVRNFFHPHNRSRATHLVEYGAHEIQDSGSGGSFLQLDAKRREHERFARELAAHLERAAEQGAYRSLAVLASSPLLGELKEELGEAAAKLLTVTHDVDLTAVGPAELERRILTELAR